jgi:hypothetical protein
MTSVGGSTHSLNVLRQRLETHFDPAGSRRGYDPGPGNWVVIE